MVSRFGCLACGAPLIWARTQDGTAMSLDAEPRLDGEWLLDLDGGRQLARPVSAGDEGDRYKAHISTCPERGH